MLGPLVLILLSAALFAFAFWLGPGRAPDSAADQPAAPAPAPTPAPAPEQKTEFLSRDDMFPSASPAAAPPESAKSAPEPAPTEILTWSQPESSSPATEFLSLDEMFGAANSPPSPHAGNPGDTAPTTAISREAFIKNSNNAR